MIRAGGTPAGRATTVPHERGDDPTTENTEKGWPGKRDAAKLTEKGAAYVVKKLRDMARTNERTPGAEG